jgi:hypothetical protein
VSQILRYLKAAVDETEIPQTCIMSDDLLLGSGNATPDFQERDASESEQHHRYVHDIGTIADDLVADDSLDRQFLYNRLYQAPTSSMQMDMYHRMPRRDMRLSDLERTFERKDSARAISRFSVRSNLKIDDEYIVPTDSLEYCFSCNKTFLDFILVVGADTGMDMFIPNVPTDLNFGFQLDLHLRLKEFRAKQGMLGFNPSGAMLCIGQTAVEDMWIAMAPRGFLDKTEPGFVLSEKHGDTRLSPLHHRILLIFLIKMLAELTGRHFYLYDPYEINIETGYGDININTNAL